MTPEGSATTPEPDFILGPLAVVAAGAFIRAARRRKPILLLCAIAAVAAEFRWPAYNRLKRSPALPRLVAHYPDA
jgi:hypothetical protein